MKVWHMMLHSLNMGVLFLSMWLYSVTENKIMLFFALPLAIIGGYTSIKQYIKELRKLE